ncbi:uncharacterized protein BJ212DRAFT_1378684 [Suillus subaureus]|uniref:Uncharacterized protein n=1 Tax=Suillus subaureus TaxID=48587 RepID=A0A9P7E2U0_9AGAM|nr:uncharacterized protein BJ212DRAFT_1378684 [Suillus subaureus]KAG1809633.1 hypothetical protein BJ212DRAFT_1378684 [Suillus subaureus]
MYTTEVAKSDSAYSKLPFNKVDARLPMERMPLERSSIERYIARVITSSNSAALINLPIIRCSTFIASKMLRVDAGTHTLSSRNPPSTSQTAMEITISLKPH